MQGENLNEMYARGKKYTFFCDLGQKGGLSCILSPECTHSAKIFTKKKGGERFLYRTFCHRPHVRIWRRTFLKLVKFKVHLFCQQFK